MIAEVVTIAGNNPTMSSHQLMGTLTTKVPALSDSKLDISHIRNFCLLLEKAMNKFSALGQTGGQFSDACNFLCFCKAFKYGGRIGLLAINALFYEQSSQFLFGTASQFR